MPQRFLVVGAGIAGLATAVALRRVGHDVRVIEGRAESEVGTGAGISIWPNALAALDDRDANRAALPAARRDRFRRVAEQIIRRFASAAQIAFIDHIIMHQGCGMQHFSDCA